MIIDFETEKNKRRRFVFTDNTKVSVLESYVTMQEEFSLEHLKLKNSLKTKKSHFKFPTILCNYRKDINPVAALYYVTQETLLLYDRSNTKHKWVISLYNDSAWVNSLMESLTYDISKINEFCDIYKHSASVYINKKIKDLVKLSNKFTEYLTGFTMFMLNYKNIIR